MDQRITEVLNEFKRLSEKVAILTGERGADGKAITAAQLSVLKSIPASITAAEVTAAPTAADFNALRKDVQEIVNKLRQLAN